MLIERLETWLGISGTMLKWFKSYLTDRTQFVILEMRWPGHLRCLLDALRGRFPGTSQWEETQRKSTFPGHVSRLGWECLGIPQEELEEVSREKEVCLGAFLGLRAFLLRLLPP